MFYAVIAVLSGVAFLVNLAFIVSVGAMPPFGVVVPCVALALLAITSAYSAFCEISDRHRK